MKFFLSLFLYVYSHVYYTVVKMYVNINIDGFVPFVVQ